MTNRRDLDSIFLAAVDIEHKQERAAFIDGACGQDSKCRAEVERLLAAHDKAGSFMREADGPLPTVDQPQQPGNFEEGTEIGNYKLLQRIGEGGFGAVYMAEQQRPVRRKVALKIVKPGMDSKDVIARFEAERQALALMDHPNIAKVLDAGTTDNGRPYFVMELVKGVPVTEYCDKNRLSTKERLELFVTLCHAVQHAHQKGVIHRDIKPSNIMVTLHDGKPVPKVIDFGVSKALNQQLTEKTLFTRYGQMIGTPQYMSPEQAEMSGLDVDTRSDIFSLGVVLYELLTGQTPLDSDRLRSAGFVEMQRMIQNEEPPRPSVRLSTLGERLTIVAKHRSVDPGKLRQTIQGELDWIVMKALEKDRARRYASASSFADDVERYLADEPIEACPPSTAYRLRKFARRNKGPVAAALAVTTALVIGIIVATVAMISAMNAQRVAEAEESRADEQAKRARALAEKEKNAREEVDAKRQQLDDTLYAQRISRAYEHVLAHRPIDALQLLKECPDDLRDFEWHLVKRLCHDHGRRTVEVPGRIHSVSIRALNESVETPVDEKVVIGLHQGTALVFDPLLEDKPQECMFHSTRLEVFRWVQLSPTHDVLAAATDKNTIELRHIASRERLHTLPEQRFVATVAFSPDGKLLASVGEGNEVRLWDVGTGARRATFRLRDPWAWAVCFSPDGRLLAAGGADGDIGAWDLNTEQLQFDPRRDHWAPVTSVCFSPDGTKLASASFDLFIRVLDVESGNEVHGWKAGKANINCVAYNPSGTRMASASSDATVTIWDATTFTKLLVLRDHDEDPKALAFSSDGKRLFSGGFGAKVYVWDGTPWDTSLERTPMKLEGFKSRVLALTISRDGSGLAAGGEDGVVKIWRLPSGEPNGEFQMHGAHGVVFTLEYNRDGRHIFSSGGSDPVAGSNIKVHVVKRWNTKTGAEDYVIRPEVRTGPLIAAVSPTSDRIITSAFDGDLEVWKIPSQERVGTLGRHERQTAAILFARNGRHLVSASEDRVIKLWDASLLDEPQEGEVILRCKGIVYPQMGFDTEGRLLVVGDGNDVLVYDVDARLLVHRLSGHGDTVNGTVFSHNGKIVASGSTDGTVKLWDASTGALIETLLAGGAVYRVAFTPDGAWLASAGEEPNVKLWNLSFLEHASTRAQPGR